LYFDGRRITGAGTIALDPTFGSLTSLSELVSLFLCFDGRSVTGTGTYELDRTFGSLTSLSELVSLFLYFDGCRFTGTGTIALDPTFGSLTSLSELVSLVEVFSRLFRLEGNFFGVQSVDTVSKMYNIFLSIESQCLFDGFSIKEV